MSPRLTRGPRERQSVFGPISDTRAETSRVLREAVFAAGTKRVAGAWGVCESTVYKAVSPTNEEHVDPLWRVLAVVDLALDAGEEEAALGPVHLLTRRYLAPVTEVEPGHSATSAAAKLLKESGEACCALLRRAADPAVSREEVRREVEELRQACDAADALLDADEGDRAPDGSKTLSVRRRQFGRPA